MTMPTGSALGTVAVALALSVLAAAPGRGPAHAMGLEVKFENDRVRVPELRLKPGEREAQHLIRSTSSTP